MKLTAKIKLLPTPQQADALRRTLERCNAACNFLSDRAWETKTFRQYDLHKLAYYDTRAHFDLSAQMTVRCIAKVADAYKLDRKTKRAFKPHGSIAYDDRVLSWRLDRQTVSIWSVDGRLTIPFACGERQRVLLQTRQGETDPRTKIAYKAALAGVPVILVDPRHTSRTCPACGCVDRRNRPDQSTFSCVVCGFAGAADHIAAVNIASRGAVNRPYVSDTAPSDPSLATAGAVAPGTSSRL